MTVRLRAHHLLCMLTYVGRGYSPAFVVNYSAIIDRLGAGEDVLLVGGPDDVCAPLLGDEGAHCRRASVTTRDERATAAVGKLLGRPVAPGTVLSLDREIVAQLRSAFAAGAIRRACEGCEWAQLCTDVAGQDYAGVRLTPPRPPAIP